MWTESEFHPVKQVLQSIEKEKPDLILDAGDYEIETLWPVKTVNIPGNHDYYGKNWTPESWWKATKQFKFADINIVMTTLWTDLNKNEKMSRDVYYQALIDCHHIRGFKPEDMYAAHVQQKKWLENEARDEHIDIVVTHHCPSFKSVHPRYKRDPVDTNAFKVNYGFASNLDDLVEHIAPKYWIHGHTHDEFFYKIGNTQVICNSCGYPSERGAKGYQPVYIEV